MTEAELDDRLVDSAYQFLSVFSPDKPPRYASGGERPRKPNQLILKSLDEAQFVLNQASTGAIRSRSTALARQRRVQKFINAMHFVTASSFVLLVAGAWPEIMKWAIPAVSLGAGLLAIAIPASDAGSERQLFNDIDEVSELSGRIVKIQTAMQIDGDKLSRPEQEEALAVLDRCNALAKRYELDQIAASAGFLPRPVPKVETP